MAISELLQWIGIAIVAIVVLAVVLIYYLGKERGYEKAMEEKVREQEPAAQSALWGVLCGFSWMKSGPT